MFNITAPNITTYLTLFINSQQTKAILTWLAINRYDSNIVLETPHVVVGAAIASRVTNPVLSLPLVLGSHFILDMIPHWNPHLSSEVEKSGKPSRQSVNIVIADASLALIAGFLIASRALPNIAHTVTILLSCFISVLPDIVEGPYFFLGQRNKTVKKWIDFQKSIQSNASAIPGLITQFITIAASLWWVLA
jgi:hypothetical protein